ncbi:hypothetical protein TPHA_0E02180 [Tetrapisispora phaffii CBS 4417]|uniref:AMP-dependent synthetase/ligase domain-containing protein n=1 Tax=Tetrapisispora phaffii (strain ATCC 24235 / CBS 4417 / NBRC 1672 / NRRL Y-8282 / UCD 70-5) TaxID=1071381 RepID=G8BTT2_TETPH|nr:hypothetical protein TPHA_0E02180 [Tetrapisispora phaffii CBS 4417]CCE63310.1 hypothetical protein TPHA_0E02180 [Tetrapisispora phaffii CBS 4417]
MALDLYLTLKLVATIIVVYFSSNWIIANVIFPLTRDLSDVSLLEQASISAVRKDNETAHYRNFLIPSNFPLTTGLNIALGYKFRNGNFGDVWNAILTNSDKNFIRFSNDSNKKYNLQEINSLAKLISKKHFSGNEYKQVGITVNISSLYGFIISLATMMATIRQGDVIPHFLSSVPRQKVDDLDVLVIDSWKSFKLLNGSLSWYKLLIVCDTLANKPHDLNSEIKVVCWDELVEDCKFDDNTFEYSSSDDKADDFKSFAYITSPSNETTCFAQMNLVSSIAAFFKIFPIGKELTSDDELAVAGSFTRSSLSIQLWNKVFAVLLVGGSVSFVNNYALSVSQPTLLFTGSEDLTPIAEKMEDTSNSSLFKKITLSWSTTLLSEGIFSKIAQTSTENSSNSLNKLRCIFLGEIQAKSNTISSMKSSIPRMKKGIRSTLTTIQLNKIRALFGSRVVAELYFPYMIMGPLAATNYYDYRVISNSVESAVSFHGALCTSLEAKFVATDENEHLDISSRQGMLCIRGFTIGKPYERTRLDNAIQLSEKVGGGEGWMPMVGIFGLFGHDGCLYTYN